MLSEREFWINPSSAVLETGSWSMLVFGCTKSDAYKFQYPHMYMCHECYPLKHCITVSLIAQ